MDRCVRVGKLIRLLLKTHEHLSKVDAHRKIRNLPAAHFEILVSFRDPHHCISFFMLEVSAQIADLLGFEPGL